MFISARRVHKSRGAIESWLYSARGFLAAGAIALTASGCASNGLRIPVPEKLASEATPPGLPGVRVWGDQAGGALKALLDEEVPRARARLAATSVRSPLHHDILALSGGADDGAFGAGLLVGWTQRGNRPAFDLVTGVSAGALIAPFAFLGPSHDRQLEAMFKLYSGEDFYRVNVVPGLLGGSSLADSAPLATLIAKYVDARLVVRLAEERGRGRLLVIGTTNLDAQRPVYWDIGRIAQSQRPEATELIRKILLASASVPALFPPVTISVVAGTASYQEMHVDGGPTREVFLAPSDFSFRDYDARVGRRASRSLWVIRNGKLDPEYAPVTASTLAISQRSIETLTKYQGLGDLARMYHNARSDGLDFNLAAIPATFSAPRPQPFDRAYMAALFETGRALGKSGGGWLKAPPGVAPAGR